MGREIKRVAAGFDWPLGQIWSGYQMPKSISSIRCEACDESGYNAATKQIADDFYDHAGFGSRWTYQYGLDHGGRPAARPPWKVVGDCRRWMDSITQDEVDALISEGRLMDFTHARSPQGGWKRHEGGRHPTAAEVNAWASGAGFGHDGINRAILIRTRAERLGVYGYCPACDGAGAIYRDAEHKALHDAWERTEPPAGDWWQMWETVSEGSPVTPAFATASELVDYLVEGGDLGNRRHGEPGWNRRHAQAFVEKGWAPSLLVRTEGSRAEVRTPENVYP